VVAGQLTLGQLVASEIIVAAVVAAFARLGKQLETWYDLLAAVDKVGVLLDLPLERETGERIEAPEVPARVEAHAAACGDDRASVLENVSVRIEPGERVALVGPAASGKSTLVELLCGVRPPSRGYVTLDDHDLRDLQLETLRQQVMCIREPEIFGGSIAENLRVGSPGASVEEIDDALAKVGLLDEIRSLPDGIATVLATDGGPLSRSQIVRLMLARAFVARPRLLALDGAVAHLDAAKRKPVIEALFDPAAPWTLLIVSEHEDMVDRCDRRIDMTALHATSAAEDPS
jgi:ABC-type bacteriocin/lantibiotic exporter with double-glycine peptidase domain